MLLRVQHETKLSYSEPVTETVFEVRMAPPSDEDQTNLGYRLRIDALGTGDDLSRRVRQSGRSLQHPDALQELVIRATSIVRTHRGGAPSRGWRGVACEPTHDDFRTASKRSSISSPARW